MGIVIDKSGPEGNAFHIMAYVNKFLKMAGRSAEWPEIQKEMMSSNYEDLCKVAERVTSGAVQVVDGDDDEEDDFFEEEDEDIL